MSAQPVGGRTNNQHDYVGHGRGKSRPKLDEVVFEEPEDSTTVSPTPLQRTSSRTIGSERFHFEDLLFPTRPVRMYFLNPVLSSECAN